jgi:hypothetical protein
MSLPVPVLSKEPWGARHFTNLRFTNPSVPNSPVPSSSVPNLIFTILQKMVARTQESSPSRATRSQGQSLMIFASGKNHFSFFSIVPGPLVDSRSGTDELGKDELW